MSEQTEEMKDEGLAMTAAERQQKRRKKLQDIAAGAYTPTLLEQAKAELTTYTDPSLQLLQNDERFKDKFSSEEAVKLQNWISNHR